MLDHLEPALDLALRVREHLAVLVGEDGRDLAEPVVDELADPEHQLRAARERDLAPGRERRLRGGDRAADLLAGGEVDLARLGSERRVVDRPAPARLARNRAAVDPVTDPAHLRVGLAGSLCDLCHEASLARLGLPHGAPRVRDLRSPAPRGRGMRQRWRLEELERQRRLRAVRRRRGAPHDEGALARSGQPDGAHVRSRPRAREGRVPAVPRPRAPRRVRQRQAGARPGRDRDRPRQPRTSGATSGWTASWSARA